jgi:hypothetical protein
MIPKLEECARVENSDAVYTRSDQSEMKKKFQPSLPHQPHAFRGLKDNSPHIFQFTSDCGIKIPLTVMDTPFSWLKCFLAYDRIHVFTIETNRYAHQYLSTVALSLHYQDHNYKHVTKDEM